MEPDYFNKGSHWLLDAICEVEDAALQLRKYAASVLPPESKYSRFDPPPAVAVDVRFTPEGWLTVTLPEILPKRGKDDRGRFLGYYLANAVYTFREKNETPKFQSCVLVYEFIYDKNRGRRFIDHDNLELKHCQDILEAHFLTNDTSALCNAFLCSHRGEKDSTRIWILEPKQFQSWLETYSEYWM